MSDPTTDIGGWGVPLALFVGSIRVGTPFLFVSLGECITEKAGRVNLGLEGTLIMGAMTGYGVSWKTGSPWLGVAAAGAVGGIMGIIHAVICNRPRVNSVAVGIALMILGLGLASYLGTPLIKPKAPHLPDIDFTFGLTESKTIRDALSINALFVLGVLLAPVLSLMFTRTRWGMVLRLAGESEEATAALGYSANRIRIIATALGGVLAGIGGSYLSLYYPGSWNERIVTGQGLMAVALVIFARWEPMRCLAASLLFGGVGSLGLALQGAGLTSAATAYLWNTAPYVLTLAIMVLTSSRARALAGAPGELVRVR